MNPRNFFIELGRRSVYKIALAYGVVAWLLIQIATQVFPSFAIPKWAVQFVIFLLILGFPVALVLANLAGLAEIQTRSDAVTILRRLLSVPAGEIVSIARLKIDPVWDPIRNDPAFQELLTVKELVGPNK